MRRASRSPVLAGHHIQEADRFHIGAFVERHFNLLRVAPSCDCLLHCLSHRASNSPPSRRDSRPRPGAGPVFVD